MSERGLFPSILLFGKGRTAVENEHEIRKTIIELERGALDRWAKGDPDGFIELSSPDVAYFDPFIERRLDGIEALGRYYEALRGKILIDRYEILNPKVQLAGDTAVLTFNFVSYGGGESRWNCTEVYHRTDNDWRIIQTHWSFTLPTANV
jgi:hypothetical protein